MAVTAIKQFPREYSRPPGVLAGQAISRALGTLALGTFPSSGNRVAILRDAAQNYSGWLQAISAAKRTILFENYFIHADSIGREFACLLAEKARQGVEVRVIHDWVGSLGRASCLFWRPLRAAGVRVRCFNPPQLQNPLGWLRRDHRKMLAVDGALGFVSGLCVGSAWVGDARRGIDPWRDTGLRIEGPALVDLEFAFDEMWRLAGNGEREANVSADFPRRFAGGASLRVVSTHPNSGHVYRFDQLLAAVARKNIWLTDAYFIGTAPYMQALSAAARDGVDVRLLLPRSTDLPLVRTLSRTGYQTLLESGVRLFEWNGPMLHAKTAVADGCWARVGSSNMNLASWLGNWELDVVVEDKSFAEQMEEMYLEDLASSIEVVLSNGRMLPIQKRNVPISGKSQPKAKRALAKVLHIGTTVEVVATNRRVLGSADAPAILIGAGLLLFVAVFAMVWPLALSSMFASAAAWVGISLLIRVAGRYLKDRKQLGTNTRN